VGVLLRDAGGWLEDSTEGVVDELLVAAHPLSSSIAVPRKTAPVLRTVLLPAFITESVCESSRSSCFMSEPSQRFAATPLPLTCPHVREP